MTVFPDVPQEVDGHGLLTGKVVVGDRRRRHRHRLGDRAPGAARGPTSSSPTITSAASARPATQLAVGLGRVGERGLRRHLHRPGRRPDRLDHRPAGPAWTCWSTTPASAGETPVVDMTDEEWDRVLNVT